MVANGPEIMGNHQKYNIVYFIVFICIMVDAGNILAVLLKCF